MKESVKNKILALYKKHGEIEIRCEGSMSLPIDAIHDFQGDLKKRSEASLIRLIASIFAKNFIAPFFVFDNAGDWTDLDGHGRVEAINAIREAGVSIPGLFPVAEIKAKSIEEAKEILLAISSQYGEFNQVVLDEWVSEMDADIAETLRIVDTEVDLAIASLSDGDGESDGVSIKAMAQLGDIWEFGLYRLICGDNLDEKELEFADRVLESYSSWCRKNNRDCIIKRNGEVVNISDLKNKDSQISVKNL